MKTLILAAFAALSLGVAAASAEQPTAYHAPAHNFYQNNWMANG
jgi:Spy/CpxP family protein refolding chaperone